jgi:hypothetical protein
MLERLSAELEVYDRFAKRSKDEHLLHKVNLGFDHFNIIHPRLLTDNSSDSRCDLWEYSHFLSACQERFPRVR